MLGMTEKQRTILEFLRDFYKANGMPPTVREITDHFEFKSPKATQDHIAAMVKKGFITKEDGIARGIQINVKKYLPTGKDLGIPIIGAVAAGSTILAEENVSGYFNFKEVYGKTTDLFALLVRGDSMVYANINDGDYVIVRKGSSLNNGDIGVAVIDGEATVKRFRFDKKKIILLPENTKYKPIEVDPNKSNFKIAGKVLGVHRLIQ